MPGVPKTKDEVYKVKRIPKSRFFDIDEISDKSTKLPHMLPTLQEFEKHMERLRIKGNDKLIIYDDEGILGASRVLWTFHVFGVKSASVLDGGLPKWEKEVGKAETGEPSWTKGSRALKVDGTFKKNDALVKDMKQIQEWVTKPPKDFQLVDARAVARFKGLEPDPRGYLAGYNK